MTAVLLRLHQLQRNCVSLHYLSYDSIGCPFSQEKFFILPMALVVTVYSHISSDDSDFPPESVGETYISSAIKNHKFFFSFSTS